MKKSSFNAYMSVRLRGFNPRGDSAARLSAAFTVALLTFVTSEAAAQYTCPQTPPPAMTETYQGFLGRVHELNGKQLPYRLFVPEGYDKSKAYPLVLHLHHAGLAGNHSSNQSNPKHDNCVHLTSEMGSGDDYGGVFTNRAVDKDGNRFDTQEKYPHFVVAPHAPTSNFGFGGGLAGSATRAEHETRPLVEGILEAVKTEYNIDPARLYVTGVSMGCYGTWDIIMRKPGVWAAASPQSCQGDPDKTLLAKIKDMPIWSMIGSRDSYLKGAEAMANAMKEVNATQFTFTVMQDVGHSINDRGYDYPGFIDWMFAQRLAGVQPPGTGGAGATGGGSGMAGAAGSGGASGGQAGQAMGGAPAASAGTSAGGGSAVGGNTVGSSGPSSGSAGAPGATPGAGNIPESESSCAVGRLPGSRVPFALILALSLGAAAWRRSERAASRRARRPFCP